MTRIDDLHEAARSEFRQEDYDEGARQRFLELVEGLHYPDIWWLRTVGQLSRETARDVAYQDAPGMEDNLGLRDDCLRRLEERRLIERIEKGYRISNLGSGLLEALEAGPLPVPFLGYT